MASLTNGVAGVGCPSSARAPNARKSGVAVIGFRLNPRRSSRRRRCSRLAGSSAGSATAGHLVAQRPHGVEAHGLVAGRVADQVGVRPVGVAELVVHGVEERGRDEAAGRDRAAGVARRGHVVEEEGAERAVEEVEGLEVVELGRRQRPAGRHHLRDVDVGGAPRSEGERHGPRSFPPAPPGVRRVPGPDCTSAPRLLQRVDGDLAVVAGALGGREPLAEVDA